MSRESRTASWTSEERQDTRAEYAHNGMAKKVHQPIITRPHTVIKN